MAREPHWRQARAEWREFRPAVFVLVAWPVSRPTVFQPIPTPALLQPLAMRSQLATHYQLATRVQPAPLVVEPD